MDKIRAFFAQFSNLFGTLTTVTAGITIWLGEQGCLSTGDLTATCTISWLPVSWMPYITGAFIVLTVVGKLLRPGGFLRSIFGSTAVVVPDTSRKSGPGTVTPEQVKTP